MKGTTFRVSHPHWKFAVLDHGGGRVLLIGVGGRAHLVLSSQQRAEQLVGKLAEYHVAQPGGRSTDQNAWSKEQTFRDFSRIEAISERTYGRDGVLYEKEENEARERRESAQRESDADRRARQLASEKARQKEEEEAAILKGEEIKRRRAQEMGGETPPV